MLSKIKHFFYSVLIIICALSVNAQDNDTINTLFQLSLQELMNINVISASKKEEPIQEAPATIMVITSEQIKERGYESLEDILRDIPGFDLVHVHGTFPTIWAQRGAYGAENKRTLLMIDGIVENNILEGNVLGGPQYSLHFVDQVEIIWGPASALYGANAFNGIINIITKKGEDVAGISYEKGYGTFNSKFDKFIAGTNKDDLNFTLAGSLYSADGPVFAERHPEYNNSYVDNAYSIVSRLNYKDFTIGFHRFDRPMGIGQFSNTPSYYQIPGYGFENNEGTSLGGAPTDINGEKPGLWHSITQTLFTNYEYSISSKTNIALNIFYKTSEIANDTYEYDYLGNNKFSRDVYAHWSNRLGGEIELDHEFNSKNDVIVGVKFEQSNIEQGYRNSEVLSDNDEFTIMQLVDENNRVFNIYNNTAVFGQYRLKTKFLNKTNFTLGVRYDYSNIYGSTTNPRFGFIIKPNDKLSIKGLVGTAYRAPNSFELFTETTIRIPNPDLKPEELVSHEIGILYHFSENVFTEVNFFYNDFYNLIVSNVAVGDITGDGVEDFQNQNIGSAQIYGAELKTNFIFSNRLSSNINFTWQDGSQSKNNITNDIPNIASYKANIGLRYNLYDLLTINFMENIVGDRTTSITNPYSKINGYYISNLFISSKKFFDDHFSFSVVIRNLFDQKYYDPGIRAANGEYYSTRHIQPGRTAFLKLQLYL